jgi:CheY-like chemotaxis protein
LGLSISKKLLEMMNGSISVESAVNKGSRFIIHLPEIAIASIAPRSEGEADPAEEHAFSPSTVLVVDDIPSNRDMIAALLADAGLDVLVAQNGQVAVDLAREKRPACVIMDVLMPVLDGVSAAKIIKQTPETGSIPIIALTTVPQAEVVNEEELKFFAGRLNKPVTSHDLFEELKKHLTLITPTHRPPDDQKSGKGISFQSPELPSEYHQKALELLGAVRMEDIRNYAQRLVDFGKTNHLPAFRRIGKRLAEHADHFDIAGVRRILRRIAG